MLRFSSTKIEKLVLTLHYLTVQCSTPFSKIRDGAQPGNDSHPLTSLLRRKPVFLCRVQVNLTEAEAVEQSELQIHLLF